MLAQVFECGILAPLLDPKHLLIGFVLLVASKLLLLLHRAASEPAPALPLSMPSPARRPLVRPLPPAGIRALDILEQRGPELMARLAANARAFRSLAAARLTRLVVVGGKAAAASPLVHLRLAPAVAQAAGVAGSTEAGDALMERLAAHCLKEGGVLVAPARYSKLERMRPPPSLRIALSAGHEQADVEAAAAALQAACEQLLPEA